MGLFPNTNDTAVSGSLVCTEPAAVALVLPTPEVTPVVTVGACSVPTFCHSVSVRMLRYSAGSVSPTTGAPVAEQVPLVSWPEQYCAVLIVPSGVPAALTGAGSR